MKRQIVYVYTVKGYLPIYCEQYDDYFYLGSPKWKCNLELVEDYDLSFSNYFLIDLRTGFSVLWGNSLNEINEHYDETLEKFTKFTNENIEYYFGLVKRYNEIVIKNYSTNDGISEGNNESKNTNL